MSRVRYQHANCDHCGQERIVYEDIHPIAFTCPTCSRVKGVIWDPASSDGILNTGNCPARLIGEDLYDWDWLNYEVGKRKGDGTDESMGADNR